ncbi:hypothetical protein CCACVL1_07564 [Corchorus capsularis]|uniref:Uncharacterized protein n=1 Tax=Corchorus capsularis TaxID=210143 RepID=A0A1R3J514_COCAP|nr:hypothetical protein CCACVL1_07564 [Corchorus capsularis]
MAMEESKKKKVELGKEEAERKSASQIIPPHV